jgi:hypothetical protein
VCVCDQLRFERRRLAPTPARDRCVLDDLGAGLRVVLREPRSPLNVGNERRTKLRIVGETGVVGGEAHQRREAESLLRRDRQIVVLGKHSLVATELVGVERWSAEDL